VVDPLLTQDESPPVCDYDGSDYQTSFWDQGGREYEDRAEEIALKRLLPTSGKLMLEVGAGAGRNTPRYQGFERIVLLDYSRTQLRQAQERLGRGKRFIYVAADVYKLPFIAGLFDAATMIRTLHHMAHPALALHRVRQTMRPRGIFILEFANKHNLKAMVRFALKRQSWSPYTLEPEEFAPLNFDFHPEAVRNWLKDCGFQIERQLTVSHFRIGWVKRIFPASFLAWLDSYAQLTGDRWQLSPSVFVRCRATGESATLPLDAMFCCPECGHAPLTEQRLLLVCSACHLKWKIDDGIYDFRQPIE